MLRSGSICVNFLYNYLLGEASINTSENEKGGDIFCNIIEKLSKIKPVFVILTSWRRDAVINRLKEINIPYKYFGIVDVKTLNELYNCLTYYICGSSKEGMGTTPFTCNFVIGDPSAGCKRR